MELDAVRCRVSAVGPCDACNGIVTVGETHILVLKGGKTARMNLCEFHEGELLKKMLRDYIRRGLGRGTQVGFSGPLYIRELLEGIGDLSTPQVESET